MSSNPTSPLEPVASIKAGSEAYPAIVYPKWRVRVGLVSTLIGFLVFLLGARPALFHPDGDPVVGFVQISVFLIGLAIICIGGYLVWQRSGDREPTVFAADIGLRMVATGYLISVFSGMADVFGFGSQSPPLIPYFGPWQASGVEIGEIVIAVGFMLLIPYNHRK